MNENIKNELVKLARECETLQIFIDNVGLADWMSEYITTPEGEPLTESEVAKIDAVLSAIYAEAKN